MTCVVTACCDLCCHCQVFCFSWGHSSYNNYSTPGRLTALFCCTGLLATPVYPLQHRPPAQRQLHWVLVLWPPLVLTTLFRCTGLLATPGTDHLVLPPWVLTALFGCTGLLATPGTDRLVLLYWSSGHPWY